MRRAALAAPLALAAVGAPALLFAQGLGDPLITATVSQRLEMDSNIELVDPRPGTSYFADTRLALGLLSETPTQVFNLGFNTGLRALWKAEEDFEFTLASPSSASAGFAQEWASAAIDTSFRYRQQRVDFTRPFDDILDPDDPLIVPDDPSQRRGDTTERRYDANVSLDLATDAPSSYNLFATATNIDYSDTTVDRVPRVTLEGGGTWSLRLTPVLSSTLSGRYYHYEADNVRETQIREAEVDAGVTFDPSPVLRLTARVGYADRERRERGPDGTGPRATVQDDSGPSFRSTLRYDFEDVVVNANLRVSTAAPETRISGDLRASYPLPRGELNGRVFQRYAGGGSGDEIQVTGAGVGLLQELDRVSRVNFDVAVSRRQNRDDPGDPDIDRLDLTATYSYDFTETVSGNVGYRFRRLDEDGSATSNAVFVQISRVFEVRP